MTPRIPIDPPARAPSRRLALFVLAGAWAIVLGALYWLVRTFEWLRK